MPAISGWPMLLGALFTSFLKFHNLVRKHLSTTKQHNNNQQLVVFLAKERIFQVLSARQRVCRNPLLKKASSENPCPAANSVVAEPGWLSLVMWKRYLEAWLRSRLWAWGLELSFVFGESRRRRSKNWFERSRCLKEKVIVLFLVWSSNIMLWKCPFLQ